MPADSQANDPASEIPVSLSGRIRQDRLAYWRERLAGAATLGLPADHPRPAVQGSPGADWVFEVPAQLAAELRNLGEPSATTLAHVLLAAWQALLARYTGQDDIVVGTTGVASLANTLVVRSDLGGEPTFDEILERTRTGLRAAHEHGDVPFAEIVDALAPARDDSRQPLFQVAFGWQGAAPESEWAETTSRCDLELRCVDQGDRVVGHLVYDTALFLPATIRRMAGHLVTLLAGVAADPSTRLAELPLLGEKERRQVVVEWNDSSRDAAIGPCVHELFGERVAATPDAVAVVFGRDHLTYRQLDGRSNQLARHLLLRGVGPGVVVGTCVERSIDLIVALLAILKAGGAYLPLDPEYPAERLAFMLTQAAAPVLVTQQRLLDRLPSQGLQTVVLDAEWPRVQQYGDHALETPSSPRQLAYVIFTSGSTGRPKGVLVEHRGFANLVAAQIEAFAIHERSRVLQFASFSFDASVSEIFTALVAGGALVLADRHAMMPGPGLIDLLRAQRITTVTLPPSVLAVLHADELPLLETVVSAGEACSADIVRRWGEGRRFINAYGPTEATVCATLGACDPSSDRAPSIGRRMVGARVYLLDAGLQPVPIGVAGEIYVGGPGVARGYVAQPALTAERFIPDPFAAGGRRLYATGDLGRFNADGTIDYLGRADRQIKLRGYRIEPGEIEAALCEHDDVRQAVVLEREESAGDAPSGEVATSEVELWPSLEESFGAGDAADAVADDEARIETYRVAIDAIVKNQVVLAIGTGADAILARLCAGAGAREVYVIEPAEESYRAAVAAVERAGLEDRIHVLHGDPKEIELPQEVDVCVAEIAGAIGGSAGAATIIDDARRHLSEDGEVIPERSTTQIAAVSLPAELAEHPAFSEAAAADVRAAFARVGHPFDVRLCLKNVTRDALASTVAPFEVLDHARPIELNSSHEVVLRIHRDDAVNGFLLWLQLETIAGSVLDTLDRGQRWLPVFLPVFHPAVEVARGDVIEVQITRTAGDDGVVPEYRVAGTVQRASGPAVPFDFTLCNAERSQGSTPFYAELFGDDRIPVTAPAAAPATKSSLVAYLVSASGQHLRADELRRFLGRRIPEFMVPSRFISLPEIPRTPNGKVDRDALPLPEPSRDDLSGAYAAPRNGTEETLCKIWADVLRVGRVGIHDNFFELGGDSILGIQCVSQASQAGIALTPNSIFRHETVAELAAVAVIATESVAGGEVVTGQVALLPIQRWFFEQDLAAPHHFNQAMMMTLAEDVSAETLERAVAAVLAQHDALRSRFFTGVTGWQQRVEEPGGDVALEVVELAGVAAGERAARIESHAAQLQASFDLAAGPLIKVALYRCGDDDPDRLLLVAHHLVIDGVSWRPVLADLESGLRQLRSGATAVVLPGKTSSVRQWADRLIDYAKSPALHEAAQYWLELPWPELRPLPTDGPGGENSVELSDTVVVSLSAEQTRALLQEVPAAYNTRINDVLLTALWQSLRAWTGSPWLLVDVEGHGREPLFDDVDLSNTAGWFTSLYPLVLGVGEASGPGETLKAIKEQLRQLPAGGLGYGVARYLGAGGDLAASMSSLPAAEIGFNYLGQFAQLTPVDSTLGPAPESVGPMLGPANARAHLLDVTGVVSGDQLHVQWTYGRRIHARDTIEGLADRFAHTLAELIEHCRSAEAIGYTPGDFERAQLSQRELDDLVAWLPAVLGQGDVPARIASIYPLSPMQEGLVYHTLAAPDTGAYVVQFDLRLHGELDVGAWRRAWRRVVERHTTLRTLFTVERGPELRQVVLQEVAPKLRHDDLRGRTESEQHAAVESYLEADRRRGFDLTRPPLSRMQLFQLAAAEHRLVWTVHHAVMDGWSWPLVLHDLLRSYEMLRAGAETAALTPARPYEAYIEWLLAQDRERAESYWRTRMRGLTGPTSLPWDRRPGGRADMAHGAVIVRGALSHDTTRALSSLARVHRVTMNTIVQGAWAILLHRYSGDRDVVYGVTQSGRDAPVAGIETMAGCFVNTMPFRVEVDGAAEIAGYLKRLQADAVEQRDYDYASLLDVQAWSEVAPGTPLFETLFVFENYPLVGRGEESGSLQVEMAGHESTNYPLSLLCGEGRTGLQYKLMYDPAWLDAATVERVADHFGRLLAGIAAQPAARISDLQMLSDAERRQVTVEWNDTAAERRGDLCLHHLFEQQVERTPDRDAIVDGDRALTYAQLDAAADALAARLQRAGVGPEVPVGLYLSRSQHIVTAILAVLKAGGCYVPLDPEYPRERITFIAGDVGVPVVLAERATSADLGDSLPRGAVLCIDAASTAGPACERPAVRPGHAAYVIYTSGSTGRPKGVVITHGSAVALAQWARATFADDELQGVLLGTSVCFDLSVFELFAPLSWGGTVILAENALKLPSLSARDRVTLLNTVPSAAAELLRQNALPPSVRTVNLAGEPLTAALADQLYAAGVDRVMDLYGPSEDTTYSTAARREVGGPATIGRPVENEQVYLLDEGGQPVPAGVVGELYIGGTGLARGYFGQPALTAEKFVPDPFSRRPGARLYRTGDLARHAADGSIMFLGRADHQVKLRGFRIELGEIEVVLGRHPDVEEMVVTVRDDGGVGPHLVGYAVARDGAALASAEIVAFLGERLPAYMVPQAIVTLPALPRTANGKIDRRALPAPDPLSRHGQCVGPRGGTEEILCAIWADVLGRERVGVHDDFFDLGGHSLLATQLVSRIRNTLAIEVPLRSLFEHRTVSALAATIHSAAERSATPPLGRRERTGDLPLSFAQQRLWVLDRIGAGAAYNLLMPLRLSGELDVASLERALQTLVQRHEALRTCFPEVAGKPVQRIASSLDLRLTRQDLRGLVGDAAEAEVLRLASAEAKSPFDLARGPLLRCVLLTLASDEHVLLLTMHHIVSDDWSMGVLFSELTTLYQSWSRGESAPIPELEVQYGDFALWQRSWLKDEILAGQLSYWRDQLAGCANLDLPADRPRPPIQTYLGDSVALDVDAQVTDRLRELGRRSGATMAMVLLAAWQTLLSRYTGQFDIAVGSPIANRTRGELEAMIGFFVNTLVLRTDLSGDPAFEEILRRVRETSLAAYEHQDLPFERVVAELSPARDQSRHPLFQVMFSMQNAPRGALRLGELRVDSVRVGVMRTTVDLELHCFERGGGLSCRFAYNTSLFDRATIERLVGHFAGLLRAVAANPGQRLSELRLAGDAERRRVLDASIGPARSYPTASLSELFAGRVAVAPDALAVTFEERSWTYRQLDDHANQLAHLLRARGVGPDVLVALALERSFEMVAGILGILKAGGAYVPIDLDNPVERIRFVLEDAAVALVVTDRSSGHRLPEVAAEIVVLDDEQAELAKQSRDDPRPDLSPQNLAYAIYTSGSTGRPKGVMNTHGAIQNRLHWMQEVFALSPRDVVLQKTPFGFDVSVWEFLWPLITGARLVVASPGGHRDPAYLVRTIAEHGVTTVHFVPSMLRAFLTASGLDRVRCLERVICSGEVLPPELRDDFAGRVDAELHNLYGPTEAAIDVTAGRCDDDTPGAPVSIGWPVANTAVYLLDGSLQPVPVGVPGEVYLGGVQLARGYLGRAALTAERFIPDLFGDPGRRLYRTGDRARRRPDGAIDYLGRTDDQVKIRGFRVELGEIESALGQHESVREAVALLREGEQLVGYVVTAPTATVTPAVLRSFVADRLPGYMVPAAVVVLERMPLSASGKVDRRALPAPPSERALDHGYVAPRGETEQRIAAIWCELLDLPRVGQRDNFFDLGGHSLQLIELHARLRNELGADLSVIELFQHPSVESLAQRLRAGARSPSHYRRQAEERRAARDPAAAEGIAVIAVAGRFPGASTVETLWQNLRDGVESIRVFSDDELRAAGESEALVTDPDYVKAAAVLEDVDLFDARFFGYSPREADLIDPQQRVFLECASEALERAACDPDRYGGLIGVYAGVGRNTYLDNVRSRPDLAATYGGLEVALGSNADYLTTRVSYKLNLRGPSMNLQTACSTSLVAIHEACRSLRDRQCDIALAGGVSIGTPMTRGYVYSEGGILSPDGHNRTFGARAQGTVPAHGAAVVVLKRLADAVADGDDIHAVILGSAANNDGSTKVGFTAPSVDGEAQVIAMAQADAGVSPETIGLVEAHGTATAMGDPIEVAALSKVFRERTGERQFCALGSIKSNMGHLNDAAGAAGLIKAVLALRHRELPPSLHFNEPNPEIDFEDSPFYVISESRPWRADGVPRRAGVSSFGLGGTNSHAVLQEAPPVEPSAPAKEWQLLVLSAKSPAALGRAQANLAEHLRDHADLNLADVAWTLQVGRREFEHRRAVWCRSTADAIEVLSGRVPERAATHHAPAPRSTAFLFSGQGAQYPNMTRGLYLGEPAFRADVDHCCELLRPHVGCDLRALLYPADDRIEAAAADLAKTQFTQPALFAVEYALARLWMAWGIEPAGMIGHSIGEYVAACLAGVFSLEDASQLVAGRGRLLGGGLEGAMLAVHLGEADVAPLLGDDLSVAAINAPELCVLSGPAVAIDRAEAACADLDVATRRLHTSHAFHSHLVEPLLEPFAELVGRCELATPRKPFISGVTGTWIRDDEACDPRYWVRHLRAPVRFADGVKTFVAEGDHVLLEVGPGKTLSSLARLSAGSAPVIASTRHPQADDDDLEFLMGAAGRLWTSGVRLDWASFHGGARRLKLTLPTYPFERQRHWIEPGRPGTWSRGTLHQRQDIDTWFYLPTWKRQPLCPSGAAADEGRRWLVLEHAGPLARATTARVASAGGAVVRVVAGDGFAELGPSRYAIDPRDPQDYRRLIEALAAARLMPSDVVHGWSLSNDVTTPSRDQALDTGFYSLLFLAQALSSAPGEARVRLSVLTDGTCEVIGGEPISPAKAALLGLTRVLPQEQPRLVCRAIDIDRPVGAGVDRTAELIAEELRADAGETMVAYRAGRRWVLGYEPLRMSQPAPSAPRVRAGGVYLITGGLGRVGLQLAEALASNARVALVLTGRSPFPPADRWDRWIDEHDAGDRVVATIGRLRQLESLGARVLPLQADAGDPAAMRAVLARIEQEFGALHGVVHAAGVVHGATLAPFDELTRASCEAQLRPKLDGLRILDELLGARPLDFRIATSSLSTVLGGLHMAAYAAANACVDAFACGSAGGAAPWTSIDWDGWQFGAAERDSGRSVADLAMAPQQGAACFLRLLAWQRVPQIVVSTGDLQIRLDQWVGGAADTAAAEPALESHQRPELASDYAAPRSDIERELAAVWQQLIGVERVGVDDDFFELGGHSLLATRLLNRLNRSYPGSGLTLRAIFQHPTVAQLASHLGAAAGSPEVAARQLAPVSRQQRLPLSPAQERFWFLAQLEEDEATYSVPTAQRLRGTLDVSALEWSLGEVVRRHEILRTTFAHDAGQLSLVIAEPAPIDLPLVDLSGRQDAEREAHRLVDELSRQPFDLSAGPPYRLLLLKLGPAEHVLLIVVHHVTMDEWSHGVFWRELAQLYDARTRGQPSPLAELTIQYADYAYWMRQWHADEADQHLAYWKEQLSGLPTLELPADRPRPTVPTLRGGRRMFAIRAPVADQLKSLGQAEGCTTFMTVLSVFELLLARYSGQSEIVVGTPIIHREFAEVEPLIGPFLNTLVLRTEVAANLDFRELLGRVRAVSLAAFQHGATPFEQLVEELQPVRDSSRNPLFQVAFAINDAPTGLAVGALRTERFGDADGSAKFDLTLTITETDDGLFGSFEYARDLFDDSTIERMAQHFSQLVEQVVEHPHVPVSHLQLLREQERQQLLVGYNDTASDYGSDALIHRLFEARCVEAPDAVALQLGETELSYRELDRRANQLAHHLIRHGVTPDTPVAIAMPRGFELVVGILGILKAGGAYLPLDPSYPQARLEWMLRDTRAPVVLTLDELAQRLPPHDGAVIRSDTDSAAIEAEAEHSPRVAMTADALAYVMYTSGSTGRPKGVCVRHRSVVRLVRNSNFLGVAPDDVFLQLASISFDASTLELWGALLNGAKLVVAPAETPSLEELGRALERHGVTVLWLTGALFSQMVDSQLARLAGVRALLAGGEALSPPHVRRVIESLAGGHCLINGYGPTENTTFTCCHVMGPGATFERSVPIGRAIANTTVYLLDDNFEPVPLGVPGELFAGGDGLARGYLGDPALTAEKFVPNPFGAEGDRLYRTGDLARRRENGDIEFLGRRDQQVKIRGFRIELGEIEAVTQQHPDVGEAAASVREERAGDPRLVAYLVPVAGCSLVVAEVRAFLAERLPAYMVPQAIVVLTELPLTANGKVDRRALPAPDPRDRGERYVAPRSGAEQVLCALWREVLGVERVGVHDDFFALGGHSLLAIQLLHKLQATFDGANLTLRAVFDGPTVAQLAARLAGAAADSRVRQLRPVRRDQALPPSPAQERFWLLSQLEGGRGMYNVPIALRLRGPLNGDALEWSLDEIVRRHETLRTTFVQSDGQLCLVIAAPGENELALVDLSAAGEPESAARRVVSEESRRPFDLSTGPVCRFVLLRLAPAEHVLAITIHHVAIDVWSLGVLLGELETLYRARCRGQASPLPELELQYADYAYWQREWYAEDAAQDLAYWRQQLAGLPTLEIPTDRPRPVLQTHDGSVRDFVISQSVAAQLKELCKAEGATTFMAMLAAFQLLLARYSGQHDIVVGTPIANRGMVETERMIGLFLNTLVLRTDLSGQPSFRDLLGRVREVALDAFTHSDMPFEQLVNELRPERDLSRHPLFQVLFFVNETSQQLALEDVTAEPFGAASVSARFDLTLGVVDADDGLFARFEYNRDLFDDATIERMAQHLQLLVASIVAQPDSSIWDLPLLSDDERRQLSERNRTARRYPEDRTFHQLFEEQVARRADAVAAVCGSGALTFGELNARANRLAHHLRSLGAGGTLVGVSVERGLEMLVALLAILKAGAAYVPLDPSYPVDRLAFVLADAGVEVLVTQQSLRAELPPELPGLVMVDADAATIASHSDANPAPLDGADSLAYVIFTSGSTGVPKGVQVPHRALVNFLSSMAHCPGMSPDDVLVAVTTISFDIAGLELFLPLLAGGKVVIAERGVEFDGHRLAGLLRASGATVMQATPATWQLLLAAGWQGPGVRALCGGEALPRELAEQLLSRCAELWNMYGPTETTIWSLVHRVESGAGPVPIGRPIDNTDVHVLDARGQPVPIGVLGELHLGGDGLARGYWNRPGRTAEKFVPHPFSADGGKRLYKTGDLVRARADGALEFAGRTDHQVKIRGFRIELGEIESVLERHPAVRQAVVTVQTDATGPRLAGHVLSGDTAGDLVPQLQDLLRSKLPAYMVPALFQVVGEFPRTPNGKIDRRALATAEAAPRSPDRNGNLPQTAMEKLVAEVWQDVLGIDTVSVDDNFLELGGHSLLATQVGMTLKERAGVGVELLDFFVQTLGQLAAQLEGRRQQPEPKRRFAWMPSIFDQLLSGRRRRPRGTAAK